ncbi:MAG: efflux RND transporter periplasmic adaptor subunit [Flavobacteriaceae bacterium]
MKHIKHILLLLLFLTITSCKDKKTHQNDDNHKHPEAENSKDNHKDEGILISKAQFESSKMLLGSLSEQNFPEIVKTTGMIDAPPQSKEIISSFYDGFIKKSKLLIGDKVRKGQALVTLENPDFIDMQQEYLEIKEQMVYLKSEYERQQTLYNEQITSQKSYQKAASEYKRKLAKLNGLRKKIKLLNINLTNVEQGNFTSVITLYSSISGSISEINVSKGTHISKADKIMEIINIKHIHIELTVFEKDAMKIKKDQKIRFRIPEVSNTYYEAEVHLVGKSIDTESRTVKVHGHLHHDTKNSFDIGMFVDAEIEIESKKAMAIPTDAITEDGDHSVILKLKEQENGNFIFEPIEVEVERSYANFTQIKSDKIKPTDKILIKGAYALVGAEGGGHSH